MWIQMKAIVVFYALFAIALAYGGDDPSIKGELRESIQTAMNNHIKANTMDGNYIAFDGQSGKVLKLKFEKLHEGIVKKGDFYVSCADFTLGDQKLDMDFLVAPSDKNKRVFQALVHKVDGEKRPYSVD